MAFANAFATEHCNPIWTATAPMDPKDILKMNLNRIMDFHVLNEPNEFPTTMKIQPNSYFHLPNGTKKKTKKQEKTFQLSNLISNSL